MTTRPPKWRDFFLPGATIKDCAHRDNSRTDDILAGALAFGFVATLFGLAALCAWGIYAGVWMP